MPLIRCPRCGQAYDVPGLVAVRLPGSITTCHCGEWLSGSKAAVLARLVDSEQIREIDLAPYRVAAPPPEGQPERSGDELPARPRSVRVIARAARGSVNTIFTIAEHPLWIGRQGCHVELDDADLSIRHCSISVRGETLVLRDADSHMGTFLDGREISETVLDEGLHLVRIGSALVTIETTEEEGIAVEPISLADIAVLDEGAIAQKLKERTRPIDARSRLVLVCVAGALEGQEFEVPPAGLVVGREGHVRVPDEFLSRRHFEVVPDPEGVVRVRDLGSRNGTFLNTLPARDTRVHPGDEIQAGVNRFRIETR